MIQFKHNFDVKPVLDMTPDGQFRDGPRQPGALAKLGGIAMLVAILAGALAIAALALWFALAIIPLAIAAGLIAYAIFRFQLWRAQGGFGSRRQPPV
jgi:hypothetical protein